MSLIFELLAHGRTKGASGGPAHQKSPSQPEPERAFGHTDIQQQQGDQHTDIQRMQQQSQKCDQ